MVCLPNPFKSLLFLIAIFASTTFSSKNITIHEDKVVFGAGCFWSVEKKFAELPGVINVESGYADGIGLEPKYSEITKFKNKFNPNITLSSLRRVLCPIPRLIVWSLL